MRIAIDASTWYNGRGFGRFTRELVTEMLALAPEHEYVLLFDQPPPPELEGHVLVVPQSRPVAEAAVAHARRSAADMLRFTRAARQARARVLFYPAVYSWFPAPLGQRNLVTFHDAISEHFPELVFPERLSRWFWNLKVALARAQATRFLTVSHAARDEIVAHLGIDAARIDLTTEGPGRSFRPPLDRAATLATIRARFGLAPGTRYLLYVGGFAPHKNVLGLLRGFAEFLGATNTDIRLLLVGDLGSHGFSSNIQELRTLIATTPRLEAGVTFTGFVDDATLRDLYGAAVALAMPSLSEGFGLPAIEAMACGTPVIASACASLPEVVGSAGLLFDPHRPTEIAASIAQVVADDAGPCAYRARAAERARSFTWRAAAELTFAALERCLA